MKSNQLVNQFQLQRVANPVTQPKGFLTNTMFFSLWAYPIKKNESRHIRFVWPHPVPRSSEAKSLPEVGF